MADLPASIGPYRVIRKLGGGGMGIVYEAVDESIDRHVAIKVLHPQHAQDAELTRRMFHEARAANRIAHPGLVQISEFKEGQDGTAYLVMELLTGQTLRERLTGPPLRVSEIIEIGRQIAAALRATHEKGIVHRDLKPENIMLVPDDALPTGVRAKLLDFGIAKRLQNTPELVTLTKTPEHRIMGTPAYMAPEQCLGAGGVDAKADVYSLGIILYELLAGQTPFETEADIDIKLLTAHLTKEPQPLSLRVPDVPVALSNLVHRLLIKDRDKRPSIGVALAELDLLARDPAVAAMGALGRRAGIAETAVNPFSDTMAADAQPPRKMAQQKSWTKTLLVVAAAGILGMGIGLWASQKEPGRKAADPGPAAVAQQPRMPDPSSLAPPPPSTAARVSITSEPSGATVVRVADGVQIGLTPYVTQWSPQSPAQQLRLRLPGYSDFLLTLDGIHNPRQHAVLAPLPTSGTGTGKNSRRSTKSARGKNAAPQTTTLFD